MEQSKGKAKPLSASETNQRSLPTFSLDSLKLEIEVNLMRSEITTMSPPRKYPGESINGDGSRALLLQLDREEGLASGAYGKLEPRKGTHFW